MLPMLLGTRYQSVNRASRDELSPWQSTYGCFCAKQGTVLRGAALTAIELTGLNVPQYGRREISLQQTECASLPGMYFKMPERIVMVYCAV